MSESDTESERETPATGSFDPTAIRRPHPSLLTYYLISALRWGPLYPIGLAYHLFRYRTLRYELDDEGVHMSWGVLFHRSISLTYARLQDIHLESNVVERWLGLARVHLQTASGSAKAEMTIEGIPQFGALRDFLYARMRGSRKPEPDPQDPGLSTPDLARVVEALTAATGELRAIRRQIEAGNRPAAVGAGDERR